MNVEVFRMKKDDVEQFSERLVIEWESKSVESDEKETLLTFGFNPNVPSMCKMQ